MKGVVMQAGDKKSVVLFNNGKYGVIPTPPNCEEGSVVTITYHKRNIIIAAGAVLFALFWLAYMAYRPVGFLRVTYGDGNENNAAVELTYNRMERITAIRPLTQSAVAVVLDVSVFNKKLQAGYAEVLSAFSRLPNASADNPFRIDIAQDDLEEARELSRRLSLLPAEAPSGTPDEGQSVSATFELYTLALYRKALEEAGQDSPSPNDRHWGWGENR